MFISKDDLKLSYGVDMEIGKYIVDRKVPEGNQYWKKRLLYIVPMPGYLFIPLYTDIEYRLGLPKSELLSDGHFNLLEAILHSAAKYEFGELNLEQHIQECVDLTTPVSKNPELLNDLQLYFAGKKEKATLALGTPFSALNRADAYLFSLCYFNFDKKLKQQLVEAWYALITYYLINDDLEDIRSDFEKKEENAFLEGGLVKQSIDTIKAMLETSEHVMEKINPVLANRFNYKNHVTDVSGIINSFVESQKKG